MARRKKLSMTQKMVSVGAAGLPSPVRQALSSRLLAPFVALIVPVLFFFGILSVEWVDGWPKLHFNRKRAEQVAKQAAEKIEDVSGKDSKSAELARGALKIIGDLEDTPGTTNPSSNGLNLRLAENVTQAASGLFQQTTNQTGKNSPQSPYGNLPIPNWLQPQGGQQ